jgi:hypothetical protein
MDHFSYYVRKSLKETSSVKIFCTVFKDILVPIVLEQPVSSGNALYLYSRVLGLNPARDTEYPE